MVRFRYQARNLDGELISGEVAAENVQNAITLLEGKGWIIQSIGLAAPELTAPSFESTNSVDVSPCRQRIEQEVLQMHIGRVLKSGKVIVPALRAFIEELPLGRRRRQINSVCQILEQEDATEASRAVASLPDYWIPLLGAVASANDPARVIREFLDESQRSERLRRQWRVALAYPLIISCVSALVMTFFSFLVIPVFRDIFYDFDVHLPAVTTAVLALADSITSGRVVVWLAVLAAIVVLALKARHWLPKPLRAWFGDRFPWPFGRSAAMARFSRFMADLIEAGLSIPDSLRVAGFTTYGRLRRAAWRLADAIESKADRSLPKSCQHMTATMLYALQSDLATTSCIRLLRGISSNYADRAQSRLSWTCGIIEPIIICLIGIFVGGIVVALFLPLVNLVSSLT